MELHDRVSTGLPGLDQVVDHLRLGDNVVWKVDSILDYRRMVDAYVAQARADGRRLVYVRFGAHEPLLPQSPDVTVYHLDPTRGFEAFAAEMHDVAAREGRRVWYVFDCLTELLPHWHADQMIENFFRVVCAFLYELDTIAYFAVVRHGHTHATIAGIRATTQLMLSLYQIDGRLYIHPLKVWQRYSPTMFFPHLIRGEEAVCITASSEVAELLSDVARQGDRLDHWAVTLGAAREALTRAPEEQDEAKRSLMRMLIGRPTRVVELCERYLTLADLLAIAARQIGTGLVGAKSVGMLLARKIIERDGGDRLSAFLEPHDSFYIGADVFSTYLVHNGWWSLRTRQRTREGYYKYAPELRDKLLRGTFPDDVRERFRQLLEHFGQSPIIVRASALVDDDFGDARGHTSVFCVNQGTPQERFEAFEKAVREVYASTMSEPALEYRMSRGLLERDEPLAILVQRVSGDRHGDDFFPHVAGVGTAPGCCAWDTDVDMSAGTLRLVFGLGTRAVDRAVGDYVRIVALDDPLRQPPVGDGGGGDEQRYTQRVVDVLSLRHNAWDSRALEDVIPYDLKTDRTFFVSVDRHGAARLRSLGRRDVATPHLVDFRRLLGDTEFPSLMREILALLSNVYQVPVDVEFTANFYSGSDFRVNILQCRPLRIRGAGRPVPMPSPADAADCVFSSTGDFLGGNVRIPLDMVVYVRPREYLDLAEPDRYQVARYLGTLNAALKGRTFALLGPGQWGATTPSLGVPVRFAELCNAVVVVELSAADLGFTPEPSHGRHFFHDLVESGICFTSVVDGRDGAACDAGRILQRPNQAKVISHCSDLLAGVVHVADATGLEVYSDVVSQTVLCR